VLCLIITIVEDWDALEQIWDSALKSRLHVDPREHPLLVTEVAWNTREHREKLIELAFEKYETPAFYLAKNPVLTAYVGLFSYINIIYHVGLRAIC